MPIHIPRTSLLRRMGQGLIDFSMVGVLDERTQELLAELLIAINPEDADRLVDVFLDLGVTQKPIDELTYTLH